MLCPYPFTFTLDPQTGLNFGSIVVHGTEKQELTYAANLQLKFNIVVAQHPIRSSDRRFQDGTRLASHRVRS